MTSSRPDQQDILRALGERIAELRRSASLTQDQLSELTEIDVQAIQRAETGRAALSLERLMTIGAALGVELGDLFRFSAVAVASPHWNADDARVVAAYRAVPDDRKSVVVPLLEALSRA